MDYLFICNTGSDNLSRINLSTFEEEKQINVSDSDIKIGPHGLCVWQSSVITANSYSSSISIVDVFGNKAIEEYYIGGNCNGVAIYKSEVYVTCGESNNIVVFDIENKRIAEEVPGGNLPHSVDVNNLLGLMVITNMENDTVTIYNCNNKELVKNIKVGSYPTKAVFSKDNKFIFVCESNLGSDKEGEINIISVDSLASIAKVKAGKSPIDIFQEDNMCYISNFSEGYISFIYLDDMEVVKRLFVGGMPRCLMKKGRYIYVGDNYSSLLTRYDIFKNKKQVIAIGKEPTGMTLM